LWSSAGTEMATLAQSVPEPRQPLAWFWDFLKQELTPYPGRIALVARMVIAATLVMIITMTFRLPFGAYGAAFALTTSRESPQITVKSFRTLIVGCALGAVYILIGASFFLENPVLRFLWVIVTLFAIFYAISAMTNSVAATRFGYFVILTVPLWDLHVAAELKVETTLWAVWTITIASVVTALVELVFAELRHRDDFVQSLANRLASVEELLACYLADRPVDEARTKKVAHFAVLGASRLRRILTSSSYARQYNEQMGAVVALVGRLVDVAANLTQLNIRISDDDRQRIGVLAASIASIRTDLLSRRVPSPIDLEIDSEAPGGIPLLREMERTVSLIPDAFSGSESISEYSPSPPGENRPATLFVADAFSNPEHVRFALKGGLAASLCYIVYSSVFWPGINTAITTCFLTALSTIGSSHQKQLVRISGAVVGGVVVGIGSQVFILPYLDSIAGFTLLFALTTGAAAWFLTSSPRFSYFGAQFAIAFYLINLGEFRIQTSLVPARDRVVGILLGLFMMWLIFDQLWGAPAVAEMKRTFISNLRLLAQLVKDPFSGEKRLEIERSYSLRERINANFDKVLNLADGVLFEFSSSRQQDLALRSRLRQCQPRVRTLFVTAIALLKYRLQLPGFELPETVRVAQQEFDDQLAKMLDGMANRIDGEPTRTMDNFEDSFQRLEQTIQTCCSETTPKPLAAELRTFLALSSSMESVAMSLYKEM
jgi:multidrug resistance protein MdtO